MSVKQFIRKNFQSSEYKINIPNHADSLRKWQWWGDTNKDHLLTIDDLEPFTNDKWEIVDSEADGHCFYNTLHRFLLENNLYNTQRQRTYEKGQSDGILDREKMRANILKNGKEGKKMLEPPILYLRKKKLKTNLKKKSYESYKKGEIDTKVKKTDIKEKYLPIMVDKGFFLDDSREPIDIITGFNDAIKSAKLSGKNSEGTEGWVSFGQVAVVALVLKINIIIWSEPNKGWVLLYAHKFYYDENERNNRDILREEPVCFMNFTGNHYQTLVPKENNTQRDKKILYEDYDKRYTEKREKAKKALSKLQGFESKNKFKRIPAMYDTDEKKIQWIWDRLENRKWKVNKFIKDYGQINDNEMVCETCKNIYDKKLDSCPICKKEKNDSEEKNGEEKNGEEKNNISNLTEDEKLSLAIERSLRIKGGYKKNEEDDGWKYAITEFTAKEENIDNTPIERNKNWNDKLKIVLGNLLTKEVDGNGYCMLNAINALTGVTGEKLTKQTLKGLAEKIDIGDNFIKTQFQNDLKGNVSNLGSFWLPKIARKLNVRIIVFVRAHNTDNYSYRVEEYPDKDTDDIWKYNKTYLLLNTAHYWPLKSSSDELDSSGELDNKQLEKMKNEWIKQ